MSEPSTDKDANVVQLEDHRAAAAAERLVRYIEEVQEHAERKASRHLRSI